MFVVALWKDKWIFRISKGKKNCGEYIYICEFEIHKALVFEQGYAMVFTEGGKNKHHHALLNVKYRCCNLLCQSF